MTVLKLDGDASGAVRAHADLDRALAVTKKGYQELGEATIGWNAHQEKSTGPEAVGKLMQYVGGVLTLSTAVEGVAAVWSQVAAEAKKASDATMSSLDGLSQLQAVSPTQADFDRNLESARSISTTVTGGDQNAAGRIVAAFERTGATTQERDYLLGIEKLIGQQNLAAFTENTKGAQLEFGSKSGSLEGMVDKIVAMRTKASPVEIAQILERVGPSAAEQGVGIDEALATIGTFSASSVSSKQAGERSRQYFAGETSFTPEQQALFREQMAAIRSSEGAAVRRSGFWKNDPLLSAADARQTAEARQGLASERLLSERESAYTALEADTTRYYEENYGEFAGALNRSASRLVHGLGLQGWALSQSQGPLGNVEGMVSGETESTIVGFLSRIAASNEEMLRGQQIPAPSGVQE